MPPLSVVDAAPFFNDWAATNLVSVPSQSGPLDDPDNDGAANLAEFAFGTDPLTGNGLGPAILPSFTGANGFYGVELLELEGHQLGVQIDVDAAADLNHWIRPWWFRTVTNSLPDDPPGSIREALTTYLPGTNLFFARGVITLLQAGPETAAYYVATNGSDSAAGTSINNPYATLAKAVGVVTAGQLVYVRGGTYPVSQKISLAHSGTKAQPIRVSAYPGEVPVFDFSSQQVTTNGIYISGSCWHLSGLVITNANGNGIYITSHSNIIERCVFVGCRNTGLSMGSSTGTNFPTGNLILNCDSFRNYDAIGHGQDADGFGAKFNIGPGNVFSGCRAWENADDGFDLWMATNAVVISNCWAFGNGSNFWNDGSFTGNGNGFKMGGNYVPGAHLLMGCLAFRNIGTGGNGIDQNNNSAGLTIDQNTSWANRRRNFSLNAGTNITPHLVRNNLSIGGGISDSFRSGSILISNSWQAITSPAANASDVISIDASFATAPRRDDGSLPEVPLMRPIPGGRLVDRGTTNVGIAYYGSAPDLGAFESPAWDGLH